MLTSMEFIITQLLSDINTLHTIWTEYITFRALAYHPSICINACSFLTNTGILHTFINVCMNKHMIFISTLQSLNNSHINWLLYLTKKQYGSTGLLPQLMIYSGTCTFRTHAHVRGSDRQL